MHVLNIKIWNTYIYVHVYHFQAWSLRSRGSHLSLYQCYCGEGVYSSALPLPPQKREGLTQGYGFIAVVCGLLRTFNRRYPQVKRTFQQASAIAAVICGNMHKTLRYVIAEYRNACGNARFTATKNKFDLAARMRGILRIHAVFCELSAKSCDMAAIRLRFIFYFWTGSNFLRSLRLVAYTCGMLRKPAAIHVRFPAIRVFVPNRR